MKGLYKYLTESFVFEGKFDKSDYIKHNYKYANDVITDLLNLPSIRIGDSGEKEAVLDPAEQADFKKKWDSAKITFPETKEDFDNMISKYSSFPAWTQIYKGVYSGNDKASAGQMMEGLVCYMFNDPNADIDAWAEVNSPEGVSKAWRNSNQWTVDFMNKQKGESEDLWTRDNYIACRVDGGDFRLKSDQQFAVTITSLFQGVKTMNKVLKSHGFIKVKCDDLYSGAKDTWNKADIVLVHKTKALTFFDDMKNAGVCNGDSLNNFLIEKTLDGTIIPISLKQLSKEGGHLSEVNIVSKEMPIDIIDSVKCLRIADKYQDKVFTGNVDILCKNTDGEDVSIVFRKTTGDGNNLNIEPQPTKGVARYGKAISVMKSLLSIGRDNKYYDIKTSNDDAIKAIEDYGFKIDVKSKSNYDKVKPLWKDRACVAGFIGMMNEYKKMYNPRPDKDFTVQFANFCLLSAMGLNSKGAFYKISD